VARDGALDLYWDKTPEAFADTTGPLPLDFEGYRIYVGEDRNHLSRIAQFDLGHGASRHRGFQHWAAAANAVGNRHNHERSDPLRRLQHGAPEGRRISTTSTRFRTLRNGFKYFVRGDGVRSGHRRDSNRWRAASRRTRPRRFPAGAGERPHGQVTRVPQSYRVEARWDQGRQVRDHYLWFTNLPPRARSHLHASGDLVFETPFTGSDYHGENARGVYDPSSEVDVEPPTLSGTTFAWNMITRMGRRPPPVYIYFDRGCDHEKSSVGKFLIVKSDREDSTC
jgi:hypothetical protein